MLDYPPRPEDELYLRSYPRIDAPRRVPTDDEDHEVHESNSSLQSSGKRAMTLAPPVRIEFGVMSLWIAGGGKTSRSFYDGVFPQAQPDAVDDLCFAPGKEEDQLEIGYLLHSSKKDWKQTIKSLKLELFARNGATPIWSQHYGAAWGGDAPKSIDDLPLEAEGEKWMGALPWKDTVKVTASDAHPDGLLTLAGSPYQLRLTVSGRATADDPASNDRFAYPMTAWTYLHVLSHSVPISWGDPAWIDYAAARPDIHADYAALIKDGAGAGYEKKAFEDLKAAEPEPKADLWHAVALKSVICARNYPVPKGATATDERTAQTDFVEFGKMWGEGPRLPLSATIKVRKLDGSACEDLDPKVLTGAKLLWDWHDPQPERWKEGVTLTHESQSYLEEVFAEGKTQTPPSTNCTVKLGAKPKPVLPLQLVGAFPFKVTGLKQRKWAALSEVHGAGAHAGKTGVVFQPNRMGGDKYAVTATVYFTEALDTTDAIEVPEAARGGAGSFEVLRKALVRHVIFGDLPGTDVPKLREHAVKVMRDQCKVLLEFEEKKLVGQAVKDAITAALERAAKDAAVLKNYPCLRLFSKTALDLDTASALSPVSLRDADAVATKAKVLLDASQAQVVMLSGNECRSERVTGAQRGGKGHLLQPSSWVSDKRALLLLDEGSTTFWDGEKVVGEATNESNYVKVLARPLCKAVKVDFAAGTSKDKVTVAFPANVTRELKYSKSLFGRRLAIDLDDKQKRDLKADLVKAAKAAPSNKDADFVVTITGREDDDDAKRRRECIKTFLEDELKGDDLVVRYPVVVDDLLKSSGYWLWNGSDPKTYGQHMRSMFTSPAIMVPALNAIVEREGWKDDPAIYMLHICNYTNWAELPLAQGKQPKGRDKNLEATGAYDPALEVKKNDRKAGVIVFASSDPANKHSGTEKTKPINDVFVHEIGHAMFLPHAPPMGFEATHTPNSTCLMNYNLDSDTFCGTCMLRLRGWDWKKVNTKSGELEYDLKVELGDVEDLFLFGADTPAGKLQRLQVLGLFNRPLDRDVPDYEAAVDFAWEHAKTLFPGLEDDPGKVLGDAIKAYLVEDGALPAPGSFAKLRVPGGYTPLYSIGDLMKLYPDHHEGSEPNPEEDYILSAERAAYEDRVYARNPALGAIPIKVTALERLKGSTGPWRPATESRIYLGLDKPDDLPGYSGPSTTGKPVAGGKSFHAQVCTPMLASAPAEFLKKQVAGYKPGKGTDPDATNAHVDLGGKRGLPHVGAEGGVLAGSREDGFSPIPADGGKGWPAVPFAVPLDLDQDGVAHVTFRPSRIGGDRYKLKVSVQSTVLTEVAKTTTGTMVRWRTVRVCNYFQAPPPASTAALSDDFKKLLMDAVSSSQTRKFEEEVARCVKPLTPIGLKAKITEELAKANCELILEPNAEAPVALAASDWAKVADVADQIAEDADDTVNCGRACVMPGRHGESDSPMLVHTAAMTPQDDQRKVFKVTLTAPPAPESITLRLKGGSLTDAVAHDYLGEDEEPDPAGYNLRALALDAPILGRKDRKKKGVVLDVKGKIDYATGEVTVELAEKLEKDLDVVYVPDQYVDLTKIARLDATDRPGLIRLALPAEYNQGLSGYEPCEATDKKPDTHVKFLLDQRVGLPLYLYAPALCHVLADNGQALLPGLNLVQADALDTWSVLWAGGTQEGKGMGNTTFVLRPIAGEDNQQGIDQLALHEMSHGLFLQHAPPNTPSPAHLHDPADPACVMSYSPKRDGDYCGMCVANLRGMYAHRRPLVQKAPDKNTGYIVIELKDEAGVPQADAEYKVTFPDGTVREGTLNELGKARLDAVPPGVAKVTFPKLHGPEWDKA
jgi:hypothetical protein